jgi:hypothetical protein
LRKVGEIKIEVICLSQRVEVGRVEFEDIHCAKGAQGSHCQFRRSCAGKDFSSCCPPVLRSRHNSVATPVVQDEVDLVIWSKFGLTLAASCRGRILLALLSC